jgi:UDP-glucose 4-epimerase
MAILVTGGAGYIGSAAVEFLLAKGEKVVVLDDLFRGHKESLSPSANFYQGSVGDRALVKKIAQEHGVDSCIHFAAMAYVGESVEKPAVYYENNVGQGIDLLGALLESGVRQIVLSSSCATYGDPPQVPIPESTPQSPTNPYGWTKMIFERVLEAYDHAYGLKFVGLRYFNAAGATENCGEQHEPESHLIPNILAAAAGQRPQVSVFGSTYPTPDGTAIRDYIHITDLADAHYRALQHLRKGSPSDFLNLGTGRGYSILEVIQAAREVTGKEIKTVMQDRRPGDPPRLVADNKKAKAVLGWEPQQSDLRSIIESAWRWHQRNPAGYGTPIGK